MKIYSSKFFAKIGLSVFLATSLANVHAAQAPVRRLVITQEVAEGAAYGIGSLFSGDHEIIGQALMLSTAQSTYDPRHGIRPYVEHFARNAIFLELFDTVQDVINNSFQFSASITAAGGDVIFKDIATMITISVLIDRYLTLKDAFGYTKDLAMKAFREELNLIVKITTFFYKKIMAIGNTKIRTAVIVSTAGALCYFGGSLLCRMNDLAFSGIQFGFKMWTVNQLSSPHNTSRRDIDALIAQAKKLLTHGKNQLCLRTRGIKIATCSVLYFLMVQMNQLIESASEIFVA